MLTCRIETQKQDFHLFIEEQFSTKKITVILGHSGAGKTTLLRIIAGLEKSDSDIIFNDQVWQKKDKIVPPHKRPIGFIFQEPFLFPHLKVKENLEYGYKRIKPASRKISLDATIELMDIEKLLQRDVHGLSGGEKQRIAIARSLAVSPKLLLMDEPLNSVDIHLKHEILQYIGRLQKEFNLPILYVSHAIDEIILLAQEAVLIKEGKLLAQGHINSILTRLDLPLAQSRDAESLIQAQILAYESQYNLTVLEFEGQKLHIVGKYHQIGDVVKLRIKAKDVNLTLKKQEETSILNTLSASIHQIAVDEQGQKRLQLKIGSTIILAEITAKSFEQLGLSLNERVYLQVQCDIQCYRSKF